jgi:class 3 adenylate cyclase/tetratricopeptide (TPR) repeat protein
MKGLPSGAVTFLFSDVEGSTRLVKALREGYPQILAEHRRLVRTAIAAQGGHEVDTQGDAFFVAFAGAKQAVLCALEIQRALAGHQWPAGAPVRVRIGIHTGNAVPAEGVYTGLAVHRAARICAAARGGQVLVSQATQTIIEDEEEEPGFMLSDLGERTLKGLDRPVRLFQLAAPGLDTRAPPAGQRAGGPARDMPAAPRGAEPGAFAAANRALPRDIAAFTGRQAELAQLIGALAVGAAGGEMAGLCAIDGMAGIGKTTLAVHAAHQLAHDFPDGQFFLPLHAHTAGQRPVNPTDALASLLLTAGVAAPNIPPGLEARAGRWRDLVAGKKVLLVLDDAASHDQVAPLLPGTTGSLVLVTSRRRLTALADAAVVSLDILPPSEAAALLARLAARPGVRASDAAVGEIARLCGYLPLAIGMLASQLRHHPVWTAAELAADLAAARDRLAVMRAENLSVAAVFGLSYDDLTAAQQGLFRRLGLHPGTDFDVCAAAALDHTRLDEARRRLDELYDQHLLAEPAPGRYRLHDLLREHARALAAADDPADSDAATERLLDYYLHTALAASQHIADWATSSGSRRTSEEPSGWTPELSTSQQAAAWLEAERPNLHAAASYAAAHGFPRYAIAIPAAISGFLRVHGHWDQAAALNQAALAIARQADDRAGQASTLEQLGILEWLTGDYPAAAASLQQALALFGDLGEQLGQASVLNQLGDVQQLTGDYPAAAASQQQALALFRDLDHLAGQASALNDLGIVQRLTGDYTAAAASQQRSLALFREVSDRLGQAYALNDLGVVQRQTGDYTAAAASHKRALTLFRDVSDRFGQALALDDLGVVQRLTGDYPAAAASHTRALEQFHDLGDRLGQAEALNNLGELLCEAPTSHQARDHHSQALAIAHEIGAPLEEARALEGIGRCHLHDGNPAEGAAYLRQALAIYQRIGAADARRVKESLETVG